MKCPHCLRDISLRSTSVPDGTPTAYLTDCGDLGGFPVVPDVAPAVVLEAVCSGGGPSEEGYLAVTRVYECGCREDNGRITRQCSLHRHGG